MRSSSCQTEFANESDTVRCGKPAVAECAEYGPSLCSGCLTERCDMAFCDYCYDYHVGAFRFAPATSHSSKAKRSEHRVIRIAKPFRCNHQTLINVLVGIVLGSWPFAPTSAAFFNTLEFFRFRFFFV